MHEALLKKVHNMEMQLQESRHHGEEHQFIDDFGPDLQRLLDEVGRALNKQNAVDAA